MKPRTFCFVAIADALLTQHHHQRYEIDAISLMLGFPQRHCEALPASARRASYGGLEVRRSAEREGGSDEAIQGLVHAALDCFVAAARLLAMT